MKLTVRQPSSALDARHYTTDRLRSEYLIETVFEADEATNDCASLMPSTSERKAADTKASPFFSVGIREPSEYECLSSL